MQFSNKCNNENIAYRVMHKRTKSDCPLVKTFDVKGVAR